MNYFHEALASYVSMKNEPDSFSVLSKAVYALLFTLIRSLILK